MTKTVAWKKVLYKAQPFPDNYTSSFFLERLVVNANVAQRSYWKIVAASLPVVQQFTAVALASTASYHLYFGSLSTSRILHWELNAFLIGTCLRSVCIAHQQTRHRNKGIVIAAYLRSYARSAATSLFGGMLLVLITFFLAPLLASLSTSVSTDSVIATAVGLLIIHLYTFDYDTSALEDEGVSTRLSVSSAVCASILIASRLSSAFQILAEVFMALELFVLGPYCWKEIAKISGAVHAVLTAIFVSVAVVAIAYHTSEKMSQPALFSLAAYMCSVLSISFMCPAWLIRIHKYKANINGPWDEANPKLT